VTVELRNKHGGVLARVDIWDLVVDYLFRSGYRVDLAKFRLSVDGEDVPQPVEIDDNGVEASTGEVTGDACD
jgi:hypothetical protein